MKKVIKYGSLAVIAAAVLWSADGLLRRSLYDLPATVIVFWEHVFGFAILLPYLITQKKVFATFTKKDWVALVVVSLLSGALGTVLYTQALLLIYFIPFSVVVLLQQLQPLFAIGSAEIFLKERLGKNFWMLALLALVAAYFVSFPNGHVNFDTGDKTWVAALLAVGAAACWGASTALSKYALLHVPVMAATGVRFFFTAIWSLVFVLVQQNTSQLFLLSGQDWGTIVAITCSTGMVALALYYFGLQKIQASRSTLLELTWPLSALFLGYFFLGEAIAFSQVLAAIGLMIIMYFVVKNADKAASLK